MFAIATKRTSFLAPHMSAFRGKADMRFALRMSAYDPNRTSNAKILAGNHKTEPVPACFKRQSK